MNSEAPLANLWLERKLEQAPFEPVRELVADREFKLFTGRSLYGKVTLRVSPAPVFRFIDKVEWPYESELFSNCVLDGILDALLVDLRVAPGGEFTLLEIEWRPEESVPTAYRTAAREATKEIFGHNERIKLGIESAV